MNRLLKKYLLLGLTALQTATLTALLAACSDELPGDDNNGLPKGWSRIELVLSAEPDPSTRAWDDKFATDEEMMQYALVVMEKNATENAPASVERIIPVEKTLNTDTEGNTTYWHDRRNVATITIENGNYTFYSFGNIPYDKRTNKEGKDTVTINDIEIVVGSPMPDELKTSTWKAVYNNYSPSAGNLIPMTNKEEYPVNSTRTITLHLFRMLAKINFEFTNNTGEVIQIQKITLHQLTPNGTPVYLLPPKDGQNIVNRFPEPADFTRTDFTFYDAEAAVTPEDIIVVPIAEAGTDPTPVSKSFYLNESLSTHETGQMPLTIRMKRGDKTSETRYSLMRLSGIPRNSNVFVPITLTDYVMKLKAFAYAPIGGYPPYTLTEKEDEFYCTFSTGGDFALRPSMYKYEDEKKPENWFELTDKTKVQDFTITYHDPDNIFTTTPHFEGGEIRGTLATDKPAGFKGTASVDLKVLLKTGTDGSVLQEYTRTLYIILDQK